MKINVPSHIPTNGFYYHYKHDPQGIFNNYAYEVMGVGFHTEDNCRPEDSNVVVYRPLYESAPVYQAERFFDIRPLEMFMEDVTKEGKTFPRFVRISDPTLVKNLEEIKRQMYGGDSSASR